MRKHNDESGNTVVMALIVVVGLVIGFAAGRVMSNKSKSTSSTGSSSAVAKPDTATKAADLRSALVTLGVQHMELTDRAVAAALDGSKDASAVGAALYTNGTDIGSAVGSVYGQDAEATFNSVWKLHLDQFVAYAVAGSKGDKAGQDTALKTIHDSYTVPLAQYLAKANPNLPADVLEKLLGEHVGMTAKMIDDHVAGKYTDEAADLKAADSHIVTIFSALAGGIVKQYPDKF